MKRTLIWRLVERTPGVLLEYTRDNSWLAGISCEPNENLRLYFELNFLKAQPGYGQRARARLYSHT